METRIVEIGASADLGYRTVIGLDTAGGRLDRVLAGLLPSLSRARIKALITSGHASLGGETITEPDYRVKLADEIRLRVPPPRAAVLEAQAMALDIVYEDDDLIVIDKPAGLVVHPAPGHPDRTLVNGLLAHVGDGLKGIGGIKRPGIVHRLDKDTSGLLVAAKTEAAHAGLARDFAAHAITRAYFALVWGRPRPGQGELVGAIGRDAKNRKKMAVVAAGGRAAVTHFKTLKRFGDGVAYLECRLETGRTHQIRVHLADAGHPVLGDPLYGRAKSRRKAALPAPAQAALAALNRQALHAHQLGFKHPVSGETLEFQTELPFDLKLLLDCLEEFENSKA